MKQKTAKPQPKKVCCADCRRFFGQFARTGLTIAFPTPTFSKDGDNGGIFKMYHKWRPVREVLDMKDEGKSIFLRKKPLCEKTLKRIYAGLVKFVAGGKDNCDTWLLKYNSMNQKGHHNAPSINEPAPTVAVQNRLGLCRCQFLSKQFSGHPMSKNQSLDKPAGTVTAVDHHAFVTAYYGNGFNSDTDKPAPTIPTKDRLALVTTKFIDTDSPMIRKIKLFMAAYGIIDIKMRMLKVSELLAIQGFPRDYKLLGTQSEQKKFIGNAVEVNQSRVLCEALAEKLEEIA